MKRIYVIRAKKLNDYVQYYITLPHEIAEKWTQVSKFVTIEPESEFSIRVKLVRAEELT